MLTVNWIRFLQIPVVSLTRRFQQSQWPVPVWISGACSFNQIWLCWRSTLCNSDLLKAFSAESCTDCSRALYQILSKQRLWGWVFMHSSMRRQGKHRILANSESQYYSRHWWLCALSTCDVLLLDVHPKVTRRLSPFGAMHLPLYDDRRPYFCALKRKQWRKLSSIRWLKLGQNEGHCASVICQLSVWCCAKGLKLLHGCICVHQSLNLNSRK